MKHLIIVILLTASTFAQYANGSASYYERKEDKGLDNNILAVNTYNLKNNVTYLNTDLNADGYEEILTGEQIIALNKNEYWVKNASLITSSGEVYEFDTKLKKDKESLTRQVSSEYGYILVFAEKSDVIEIFIAGEKGYINSDPFFISAK